MDGLKYPVVVMSVVYRKSTGEGKGKCIYTFKTLKPVELLPRMCMGDAGPLARGFEGRPL
jgi:hypothetical protein